MITTLFVNTLIMGPYFEANLIYVILCLMVSVCSLCYYIDMKVTKHN